MSEPGWLLELLADVRASEREWAVACRQHEDAKATLAKSLAGHYGLMVGTKVDLEGSPKADVDLRHVVEGFSLGVHGDDVVLTISPYDAQGRQRGRTLYATRYQLEPQPKAKGPESRFLLDLGERERELRRQERLATARLESSRSAYAEGLAKLHGLGNGTSVKLDAAHYHGGAFAVVARVDLDSHDDLLLKVRLRLPDGRLEPETYEAARRHVVSAPFPAPPLASLEQRIERASFDPDRERVVVELNTGLEL